MEAAGYDGSPGRDVFDRLNAVIESSPFAVHVSRQFALDDAAGAHEELGGHHPGRSVLIV
ncbi:MAG: hypothetical protein ICV87_08455 [Gemmatimonadetes bacterium]|nr:hypothetical protein [Gemmatimonadota bacterium]